MVPKLSAALRDTFTVNPRAQDMAPLNAVFEWAEPGALRPSVIARVLEAEFFQKWLNVLHVWLVAPKAKFDEIAEW